MFLTTLLALAPHAFAVSPKKAAKAADFADQADRAERSADFVTAAKLASKALKLDPDNMRAHFVFGETLVAVASGSDSETSRQLLAGALYEMQRVVELSPDSFEGAVAAGLLKPTAETGLVPQPDVQCSQPAQAEFNKAEAAFARHDYVAAKASYDTALQACPTNPTWWLDSGDAWFSQNDYAGAETRYDKALALAPCFAPAYRFKADAEIGSGDAPAGFVDATRAVACDPTYDIGWTYLRGLWSQANGRLVWSRPTRISAEAAAKGTGEAKAWAAYWQARSEPLPDPHDDAAVLARERKAVSAGVDVWRTLLPTEHEANPMWAELAEARDSNALDPAIFLWLLDKDLAPAFATWRNEHLPETVAYIKDHLVDNVDGPK